MKLQIIIYMLFAMIATAKKEMNFNNVTSIEELKAHLKTDLSSIRILNSKAGNVEVSMLAHDKGSGITIEDVYVYQKIGAKYKLLALLKQQKKSSLKIRILNGFVLIYDNKQELILQCRVIAINKPDK